MPKEYNLLCCKVKCIKLHFYYYKKLELRAESIGLLDKVGRTSEIHLHSFNAYL